MLKTQPQKSNHAFPYYEFSLLCYLFMYTTFQNLIYNKTHLSKPKNMDREKCVAKLLLLRMLMVTICYKNLIKQKLVKNLNSFRKFLGKKPSTFPALHYYEICSK